MQKFKWIIAMAIVGIVAAYLMVKSDANQASKAIAMEIKEISPPSHELELVTPLKQSSLYTVELSIHEACDFFEGIAQISYTHNYDRITERILMNANDISIENVKINLEDVSFNQYSSSLVIQSPFPIKKGEEVTLTIEFQGELESKTKNMTDGFYMCNFIPTILAYDDDLGWIRTNGGDIESFRLIEPANYEVTVHTYDGQYPIGTGTMDGIIKNDNQITSSFSANRVRGFGMFVGGKMEREIYHTDQGYAIALYYAAGDNVGEDLIPKIKKSLGTYSNIFGAYPYDQLTVIHKRGLETESYPTLIMGGLQGQGMTSSDINKIIGQQWLYYIIGNSKYHEDWLSGGLLEYLNKSSLLSQSQMQSYIAERSIIRDQQTALADEQAAIMFYEIEQRIGQEKFIEALRVYYKKYSFQMATGEEFIQLIEEISETGISDIYNAWLNQIKGKESDEYEGNSTSGWERR